jgi:DNA-directed RNA polymerase sigma subunit (sigma70/sigma32)
MISVVTATDPVKADRPHLTERHLTVLRMRFGNPPQTLGAVAEHLQVSRERVRRLEDEASKIVCWKWKE